MQSLLPIATIKDLAHEMFSSTPPAGDHATLHDPDRFLEDSLQPDPLFLGLRALVERGPIGAFRRWIDRKIEAYEDRRPVTRAPHDFMDVSADRSMETPDDDLAA